MPYQPTWVNPYLPQSTAPLGQSFNSQYMPVQPYQQPVNGIVKVNGRDSAMQYQLPPNSMSPALFDKDGKVFYIVSTDGTGAKTVETFDFTPHVEEQPVRIDGAQFVSRREFDEFAAKVNAGLGASNGIHGAISTTATPSTSTSQQTSDAQGDGTGQPTATL